MKYIKYTVYTLLTILFVGYIAHARGFFVAETTTDRLKAASDGFAIGAFLYIAIGGLSWISTTGFFDIFTYGFKKGAHMIVPGMVKDETGKYFDYKTEQAEKRGDKKTHWITLVLGLILLAISGILCILWYKCQ